MAFLGALFESPEKPGVIVRVKPALGEGSRAYRGTGPLRNVDKTRIFLSIPV